MIQDTDMLMCTNDTNNTNGLGLKFLVEFNKISIHSYHLHRFVY